MNGCPLPRRLEKIENYKTKSSKSPRFLSLSVLNPSLSKSFGRPKAGNVRRKVEHGRNEVGAEVLLAISREFGKSLEWLLTGGD